MRRRKKVEVWVVMHYEIMFNDHIDCLQFHVSSSLRAAEKYVAEAGVMAHSWWQVHPHVVDAEPTGDFEGEEVHYYSHTGKRLTRAPVRHAIRYYRRFIAKTKKG
ncbi:MAG: hypothetical protein HYS13_12790 [Planctomycetia bacterium]|nr:hypothetical protein [Planctomycetia bacterium]